MAIHPKDTTQTSQAQMRFAKLSRTEEPETHGKWLYANLAEYISDSLRRLIIRVLLGYHLGHGNPTARSLGPQESSIKEPPISTIDYHPPSRLRH